MFHIEYYKSPQTDTNCWGQNSFLQPFQLDDYLCLFSAIPIKLLAILAYKRAILHFLDKYFYELQQLGTYIHKVKLMHCQKQQKQAKQKSTFQH